MSVALEADPAFLNRLAWNVRWSDRRKSTDAAETALTISDRTGNHHDGASACRTLAWQAKWRGDFDASMDHALACETRVSETNAPDLRGDCYSILGVIHYSRHRLDLARNATERGLSLKGLSDSTWIDLMTTKSTIQRYQGHLGKAGITLMRARDRGRGADLARVEHNLARWMIEHGDPEGARTHADISIRLSEEFSNRVILPYACEVAGKAAATLGDIDGSRAHFRRGIDLAIEDDDMRALCQLLHCSAIFEARQGATERAIDQLTYASRIAEDMRYTLWQKQFALALAELLENKGDLAGALSAHKAAWSLQNSLREDDIAQRRG